LASLAGDPRVANAIARFVAAGAKGPPVVSAPGAEIAPDVPLKGRG
jgi:hypothetical protein